MPRRLAPRRPSPPLRALVAAVTLLAALVATGPGATAEEPAADPAPAAVAEPVLGDYSAAILGPADANRVRHVDVDATIAALQRAEVNTYAYMIYGSGEANAYCTGQPAPCDRTANAHRVTQTQWDELPAFAAAARAAGIDVWVYLVPPSESYLGTKAVPVPDRVSTYAPFHWDYQRWATEIAQLAVAHPNIVAIAMDDFGGNTYEGGNDYTFEFTQSYVASMMDAARAISPGLEFHVILYYTQYWGMNSIAAAYRGVVDGYVFPYHWSNDTSIEPANTSDPSRVQAQGDLTSSMTKCWSGNGCLKLGVPARTLTQTGWYGSVEQTVTVDPSAPSHRLSFRVADSWIGAQPIGHHQVQVLVDGVVVWTRDVVNYRGWEPVSVDLGAQLSGRSSARITLRVLESAGVANFPVQIWFDALSPTGFTITNPGFETSLAGWTRLESRALFDESWVPDVSYLLMPYASRLGSEGADPAYRTSASYVRTVTAAGLAMTTAGRANGTLIYSLNLTGRDNGLGDPLAIDEVTDLYGSYS